MKKHYTNKKPHNHERQCPRLGHPVYFSYCTSCGNDYTPCFKIFDCWWEYFDVVGYLRQTLSTEEFEMLSAKRPKPKVTSILELIREARERNRQ